MVMWWPHLLVFAAKLHHIAAAAEHNIVLPLPPGPYGTDLKTIELIDYARPDPYDPNHGPRKLMTSVFYPTGPAAACGMHMRRQVQYIPPASASPLAAALAPYTNISAVANFTAVLTSLRVQVCSTPAGHGEMRWRGGASYGEFPVVLFSHGFETSRLYSIAQVQAVAAQGFVVIAIDHPYDAAVVEYPDGSIVLPAKFTNNSDVDFDVRVRSKDLSFVVDQLQAHHSPLREIPTLRHGRPIEQVGAFGHSLGGVTCARAMYDDSRIVGGFDMDGNFYGWNTTGPVTAPVMHVPDIYTPFLLFTSEADFDNPEFTGPYTSSFKAWKRLLGLRGGGHFTFTDLPLLVDLSGLRDKVPGIDSVIGSLDGQRARDLITAYVTAFMKFVLQHKSQPLLDGPSSAYPEVEFAA